MHCPPTAPSRPSINSALPDLPVDQQRATAAAVKGKLYVIGGSASNGVPRNSVDVADPATNAWTTLPATNPKPISAAGVGVANDGLLVINGAVTDNGSAFPNRTVAYDLV